MTAGLCGLPYNTCCWTSAVAPPACCRGDMLLLRMSSRPPACRGLLKTHHRPTDGSHKAGLKSSGDFSAFCIRQQPPLHCLQDNGISMAADAGSGTTQSGPAHTKHHLAASSLEGSAVRPCQPSSGDMPVGGRVTQRLQNGEQCCSSTRNVQRALWSVQAHGVLQCTELLVACGGHSESSSPCGASWACSGGAGSLCWLLSRALSTRAAVLRDIQTIWHTPYGVEQAGSLNIGKEDKQSQAATDAQYPPSWLVRQQLP